jgi:hypothetical protein
MANRPRQTRGRNERQAMTDTAPCRADRLIDYLHMGYDLETAARLCGMRYEVALQVAAIAIGIENDLKDQEAISQRNAVWDEVEPLRLQCNLSAPEEWLRH